MLSTNNKVQLNSCTNFKSLMDSFVFLVDVRIETVLSILHYFFNEYQTVF